MTVKLWLLSMVLSIIAPHIFSHKKERPDNSTNYKPGTYLDYTMSAHENIEND